MKNLRIFLVVLSAILSASIALNLHQFIRINEQKEPTHLVFNEATVVSIESFYDDYLYIVTLRTSIERNGYQTAYLYTFNPEQFTIGTTVPMTVPTIGTKQALELFKKSER